jgi:uncharacterized membrane protein YozB (DUF420 family)
MDAKLVYWSAALANMIAVVICALVGVRRARAGAYAAHRRSMLTAAWLVLAFVGSYVLKLVFLGREQLELWEASYRTVLQVHETCVLVMVAGGIGAIVQARRLGLPRTPESVELEPGRLQRGLRWHRGMGRSAVIASVLGLLTASYVLWGMYERAG